MKIKDKKYHVTINRYVIRSYVVKATDEESAAHKASMILDDENKQYLEEYDVWEVGESYEETKF